MAFINYGDYYKTLSNEHLCRYKQKIAYINEVDPYMLAVAECSSKPEDYPKILYPDIVNYLVYDKSAYTFEEIKAYKGFEAYKQAVCGWVRNVFTKKYENKVVILGRVLHSQRLNEKCTNTWIIAGDNGGVLCAHCDCVAGLGETCTHVCAILFFIDHSVHRLTSSSVTDVKAYWVAPTKIATPSKIVDINFSTPAQILENMECDDTCNKPVYCREKQTPRLNKNEKIHNILQKLTITPRGCVLHSILKPFSTNVRIELDDKQAYVLSHLYSMEYEIYTLEHLQEIGSQLDLKVPIEECRRIEKETNQQANSAAWFKYRAGRITASKFKGVCRTNLGKPSMSLLRSICYPVSTRFISKATAYGCAHEKMALRTYVEEMVKTHRNFGTNMLGLCLNPSYPEFGASPDGLVECDCCGMGLVEIKCPYCARDLGVDDLDILKKVGMQVGGVKQLDQNHAYYYQMQMQLAVTGCNYCDFVVWSKKSYICERILPNDDFWKRESAVASKFFKEVVLPELLGKYFTNKELEASTVCHDWGAIQISAEVGEKAASTDNINEVNLQKCYPTLPSTSKTNELVYCVCNGPDIGTPMIACHNTNCTIEWYHMACVGLTSIPEVSLWYCNLCSPSKK